MTDERRAEIADILIDNEGDLGYLDVQVGGLWNELVGHAGA